MEPDTSEGTLRPSLVADQVNFGFDLWDCQSVPEAEAEFDAFGSLVEKVWFEARAQRWEMLAECKAFGAYLCQRDAMRVIGCTEQWMRKLVLARRIRSSAWFPTVLSRADVEAYAASPRKRGRKNFDTRALG